MRWLAIFIALVLMACSTKLGKDGRTETGLDVRYLAKTEIDRIADTSRNEVIGGLLLIADKLYKRNPKEWKKAGVTSREAALERLSLRNLRPLAELGGAREGQAAALAFSEAYGGDRVAALMFGLLSMADAAFEHKEEFYILDGLNEMKLYNCARNLDVAIWKLGHDRTGVGEPYLLSNELDPNNRNLSFEREFGRLIGLLDFMAKLVADRNGRNFSRLTQTVVSTIFLPVSFLK
ncbi:MAG: putative lipoprotein [Proteobacteria bacterium]|nr:putative lipoprotein [Pseudomonadota bacterium]